MDFDWDEIAAGLRNTVGLDPRLPVNAVRLAYGAGFEPRAVDGPVCVSRVGSVIVFDARAEPREYHAQLARAISPVILQRHEIAVTAQNVELQARAIMLPREAVVRQIERGVDELQEVERAHPYVLFDWIVQTLEEVLATPVRLAVRVATRPRLV